MGLVTTMINIKKTKNKQINKKINDINSKVQHFLEKINNKNIDQSRAIVRILLDN